MHMFCYEIQVSGVYNTTLPGPGWTSSTSPEDSMRILFESCNIRTNNVIANLLLTLHYNVYVQGQLHVMKHYYIIQAELYSGHYLFSAHITVMRKSSILPGSIHTIIIH